GRARVEPTQLVDAPAEELVHRSLVLEIAARDRRSAELLAQRFGPLPPLVVVDHDPAALSEELPRAGASDTARGARDEDAFAREPGLHERRLRPGDQGGAPNGRKGACHDAPNRVRRTRNRPRGPPSAGPGRGSDPRRARPTSLASRPAPEARLRARACNGDRSRRPRRPRAGDGARGGARLLVPPGGSNLALNGAVALSFGACQLPKRTLSSSPAAAPETTTRGVSSAIGSRVTSTRSPSRRSGSRRPTQRTCSRRSSPARIRTSRSSGTTPRSGPGSPS